MLIWNPARIQQISEMLTRVGERVLMPRCGAQVPNRVFEKTSALDVFSEADSET